MAARFPMEKHILSGDLSFFGLSTLTYIFNLFGEAFHWMLIFYLHWSESKHYLDDFIHIVKVLLATPSYLKAHEDSYRHLTNCLRIPRQEIKDCCGTIIPVFGIEIDTNLFIACISSEKLEKADKATVQVLFQKSVTLHNI